jgi:acetoin utilization protein AcuB
MMNELVSSIMTSDLITVTPEDTLAEVYKIFRANRIHHLPVVKGKKLVGILTTYDLFKLEKSLIDYGDTLVKDVMTTKLATLDSDAKVGSAVLIFIENLFHAVPIVENDGDLVGIVSTLDVMKYTLKKQYPNRTAAYWGRTSV